MTLNSLSFDDEQTGWRCEVSPAGSDTEFVYVNPQDGGRISGSDFFAEDCPLARFLPREEVERIAGEFAARYRLFQHETARRILEMVGVLHGRGYASLYIDAQVAPNGLSWRFQIAAHEDGVWPRRQREDGEVVRGSIRGGFADVIEWADLTDNPVTLADKFVESYPQVIHEAKRPNSSYVEWYDRMLQETGPVGVIIFANDQGLCWDRTELLVRGGPFEMDLPPGYRPNH